MSHENASAARLIVQEARTGHLQREESLLAAGAETRGLTVVRAGAAAFRRRRLLPVPGDVVGGSLRFVFEALHALGRPIPEPDSYPKSLRPWLYRNVWRVERLGDVLRLANSSAPVFVKPADRWKRFTGLVLNGGDSPTLAGVSRSLPVWCSDPIDFVSEWRAYVVAGQIRFLGLADDGGDRSAWPDEREIDAAVTTYVASGAAPAAFAIDFGVQRGGRTALIEVNDGFAIGAYDGIDAGTYFEFTAARWQQLAGFDARATRNTHLLDGNEQP